MLHRGHSLAYTAAALFWALAPAAPLACSVSADYLVPSIGERTAVASHVVIVDGYTVDGRLHVVRWMKGYGPDEIEVLDRSPCNSAPGKTGRSIVFLEHSDSGIKYELLSYGFWSGSIQATPEAIEEVNAAITLGLEEYLRRKAATIEVRGLIRSEATGEWQALLHAPGLDGVIRRSVGEVIHASTAKVVHIDESTVSVEMVTGSRAELRSPVIVDITIPK